jgi:hypothetical protein
MQCFVTSCDNGKLRQCALVRFFDNDNDKDNDMELPQDWHPSSKVLAKMTSKELVEEQDQYKKFQNSNEA